MNNNVQESTSNKTKEEDPILLLQSSSNNSSQPDFPKDEVIYCSENNQIDSEKDCLRDDTCDSNIFPGRKKTLASITKFKETEFELKSFSVNIEDVEKFREAVIFSNENKFDCPAIFIVKGPGNCGKSSLIESLFYKNQFSISSFSYKLFERLVSETIIDDTVSLIWIQHPIEPNTIIINDLQKWAGNRIILFELDNNEDIPKTIINSSISIIDLEQLPNSSIQEEFNRIRKSYNYSNIDEEEISNIIGNFNPDSLSACQKKILIKKNIIQKHVNLKPIQSIQNKNDLKLFDEKDFFQKYGYLLDNPLDSNTLSQYFQLSSIHQKLDLPLTYLTADSSLETQFENCIKRHPNILDKENLLSCIKIALRFSIDEKIKMSPILFLGPSGCGKTMLCGELSSIFGQDNTIFIPVGTGGGISLLYGSTPDYRGATNGLILSSFWSACNNKCCGNPIIIFDEIDKNSYTSNDANQNIYASLIQLLADENMVFFKDNFFNIPIKNAFPIFWSTANKIESLPAPLIDRLNIIELRDYSKEEMMEIVIPEKYKLFTKSHKKVLPEMLESNDIETIYKICEGRTRALDDAFNRFIVNCFNSNGERINKTYMGMNQSSYKQHKIGFYL